MKSQLEVQQVSNNFNFYILYIPCKAYIIYRCSILEGTFKKIKHTAEPLYFSGPMK